MEKSIVFIIGCLLFALAVCGGCGDPCKDVNCNNGGYCVEGDCMCPDGWEGSSCNLEKIPSKICIKSVKVIRMPLTKNGIDWDPIFQGMPEMFKYPDLMLRIWRDKTPSTHDWVVNISEGAFGGTRSNSIGTVHTFTYQQGTGDGCLNSPTNDYRISLYDDDSPTSEHEANGYHESEDDFIGGITFTPYQNGQQFPNPIILSNSAVTFEIYVEYEW